VVVSSLRERLSGTRNQLVGKLSVSAVAQEPAISLGSYYGAAIPRTFWAGWDWAFGQGLGLTILLGCGAVLAAAAYAVIRAWRRSHSWADAINGIKHAITDFLISGIGAIVIVLIGLFVWFFIKDAPTQMDKAYRQIETLHQKIVDLSRPKSYKWNIGALLDVQFRLSD
jgi:ABC-type Fe3+ transport system permease subunit